jgi:hypothetical protein
MASFMVVMMPPKVPTTDFRISSAGLADEDSIWMSVAGDIMNCVSCTELSWLRRAISRMFSAWTRWDSDWALAFSFMNSITGSGRTAAASRAARSERSAVCFISSRMSCSCAALSRRSSSRW